MLLVEFGRVLTDQGLMQEACFELPHDLLDGGVPTDVNRVSDLKPLP